MILRIGMTAATLSVLASMAAQAATLDPVADAVFTRGPNAGFHQVRSATEVNAGDTVMTGPNGRAKIVFGGGCVIKVEPGQTVTVPERCQAAIEGDASQYLVAGAAAAVIGTAIYFVLKDNEPPRPASP
jgi:hypothetical protein